MNQVIIEVIYSPERNSQVEIFRRGNGTFGFHEMRFSPAEKSWIPFGRYSEAVVDSADSAIREAKGRVEWLADAMKPRSYSLSWIRSLSRDSDAHFISTNPPVFKSDSKERLTPKQILRVGGMYLVETVEQPDIWWMGDRKGDGPITCWSPYGSLETAINSL